MVRRVAVGEEREQAAEEEQKREQQKDEHAAATAASVERPHVDVDRDVALDGRDVEEGSGRRAQGVSWRRPSRRRGIALA